MFVLGYWLGYYNSDSFLDGNSAWKMCMPCEKFHTRQILKEESDVQKK